MSPALRVAAVGATLLVVAAATPATARSATSSEAQPPVAPQRAPDTLATDTLATIRVRVTRDSAAGPPVEAAVVRVGRIGAQTDARGEATLRVPAGARLVAATKVALRPDSTTVTLRAGGDTTIALVLVAAIAELQGVVVSATRGERRVEDTPLRVEVIDEEEIAEKVAMTPGDIAMMLNETSGLRVQTINPSLGGANVRMQGMPGRYSLILADGLPLYGQTGGLGLLQVPPVDLGRVEVIKGTASALYGSAALGGVINLLSRRPGDEAERTALVNRTSRDGTDAVYFGGAPLAARWGYTLLAGGHLQRQHDIDADGWTDLAGYRRGVVRPRLYFDDGNGRTAFLTAGATVEDRDGGTLDGGTVPDGGPHVEALDTRRADVGGLARWLVADGGPLGGAIVTARGSAMEQRHDHRFGAVVERDRHRTWFGEASLALPRLVADRAVTYVVGAAVQQDAYRNASVRGFDHTYTIPALFAQLDVDPAPWLAISTSARLDAHDEFGTFVNPRLSLLLRRPPDGALAGWTTRLSAGTGAFAPSPFTDDTEATGLTPVDLPAAGLAGLAAERARSGSLDVGGPLATSLGRLELNATAFGSRVADALQAREASADPTTGVRRIALVNAAAPTRTWGGELLARLVRELGGGGVDAEHDDADVGGDAEDEDEHGAEPPTLRITAAYTYLRATECDANAAIGGAGDACARREVPLTPRHAVGVVASVEQHGRSRIGLELYYTGRQTLDDNPYRGVARPYLLVGLLGERAFETRAGVARLFLNLENLTDVRQTRDDPLLLPARGAGGRWTTDAWTDLVGFTVNGGVRLAF